MPDTKTPAPPTPWTQWILFLFHWQHTLISWLVGGLLLATRIAHSPRFEAGGVLAVTGRWERWSFTFWRLVMYTPAASQTRASLDEHIERHERVHVRQSEDAALHGFFLGSLLGSVLWALGWLHGWQPFAVWEATWLLVPVLMVFNSMSAVLRYGVPAHGAKSWWKRLFDVAYRDSEHERSAYAQTNLWPNGESYWHWREKMRGTGR